MDVIMQLWKTSHEIFQLLCGIERFQNVSRLFFKTLSMNVDILLRTILNY